MASANAASACFRVAASRAALLPRTKICTSCHSPIARQQRRSTTIVCASPSSYYLCTAPTTPCRAVVRRTIVTEISPTTSLLRSDTTDNEVYLLGTAHVSDASTQEAIDLIRLVQPSTVFVELDATRAAQLRNGAASNASPSLDLSQLTSNPLLRGLLGKTGLTQQLFERMPGMLKLIGLLPHQGGEMKAALDEADRIGARCVYGDVEFNQTINELKLSIGAIMANPSQLTSIPPPPSELAGVFSGFFGAGQHNQQQSSDPQQLVETIKTRDRAKQMTRYLNQCFPSIYHVMLAKRDAHMAKMLREHCSSGKVVAVVGMAHVEGIEREWETLDGKQKKPLLN
eukprot:CAMPEP_0183723206 /NCGR_PEP_ID=MMETSP0737-20130205/14871_1 /TAXON_ID=385413 /ORGANISM="Thalassiosira miniscula, Strain CCMP1093" /LENGTH=341 /DNA_ID=CAMNT_0025953463 /DNA_START=98 /DNA_END=1123 /DNA_ORIENTATION=+